MHNLTIHGPNLIDQSKGQFRVHLATCGDNHREETRNGSDYPITQEFASKSDAAEFMYSDQIDEGSTTPDQAFSDFYFCNCTAHVPTTSEEEKMMTTAAECTYKDHEGERTIPVDRFYVQKSGRRERWCRDCCKKYRTAYREAKKTNGNAPAEPAKPSALSLPAMVTRTRKGSKFHYEAILADGTVKVVTDASKRVYETASAYAQVLSDGRWENDEWVGRDPLDEPIGPIIFLHSRADLAAKGSPDANLIVKNGTYVRIPGVVAIVEA